jgi:hypothetical protein
MADAWDEVFRILREHKRRAWRLAPQQELEEEIIREEQRKAAWMDVPEWRTFWDEATKDFKVPEGWPVVFEKVERPEPPDGAEAELETTMHRMLRAAHGDC